MNEQEIVELLSSIQFEQSLDWLSYLFVILSAAIGGWFAAYLNTKGKNFANREDFSQLKTQLKNTTDLVEGIKTKLSNQSWITQQVWVKKQEAYETIFELLFHVMNYVNHWVMDYEEWDYVNNNHPYFQQHYNQEDENKLRLQWMKDKDEYESKENCPDTKKDAEKLKTKYEGALSSLFQVIQIKSIYLDPSVETVVKELKEELSKTHEEEDFDCHFERISNKTKSSIERIRDISKTELEIQT